jgi:hypothetical protein
MMIRLKLAIPTARLIITTDVFNRSLKRLLNN